MRSYVVLVVALAACGGTLPSEPLKPDAGASRDLAPPSTGPGPGPSSTPAPNPSTAPSPSPGAGCGTCPSGSTCGSANGVAVCKTSTGIPLFSHVFVITMENTSLASLQKDGATPYLHGLFTTAAYASDYHGVTHPSLPNYLALTSGAPGVQSDGTTAVSCDCDPVGSTCNQCSSISTLFGNCGCEQSAQHLGDQLDAAGKTWRDYGEDMGSPCNLMSSGAYAVRHLPFLYYDNVQKDPGTRCTDHVVDFGAFTTDLAGTTPALSFIAPNLNHDMHGTGLTQTATDRTNADTWLSTEVGAITASTAYQQGGVLFIVWDEDDLSGTLAKDDPIPLFVLSPYAKANGYASPTHADHYALLATIEDGLGVGRLGGANGATPLADYFQ